MPNDTRLIRCLAKGTTIPIKVVIPVHAGIDDLKKMVYEAYKNNILRDADIPDLFVWKLKIQEPIVPEESLQNRVFAQGPLSTIAVKLESTATIGDSFKDQPQLECLHIVVHHSPISPSSSLTSNISAHSSLKHRRSPSPQGFGKAKKRLISYPRKWTVNGAINVDEVRGRYYVDPGTQDITTQCLSAVSDGTYMLLAGARASGKTTRLFWLHQKLVEMGYYVFYISISSLSYLNSLEVFWKSFSDAISSRDDRTFLTTPTPISSTTKLISYFGRASWGGKKVVLLLDEFTSLYKSGDAVRDDFLSAIRELKHNSRYHAVQCVIAAGTFNIFLLNPTDAPPFNIAESAQCPYFTIDETKKLFHEFASDSNISIDDDILDDIWAKSNGHPGMVCLCGRTIDQNMETLVDPQSKTISYPSWQRFPAEDLYREILLYGTFRSMIVSLKRAEVSSCVDLLRSHFTGFLGDVTLTDEQEIMDADTLTSEGVLFKPNPAIACYRMASPLVDGLIRNQLIPIIFRDAPSSFLPRQPSGDVDVLGVLIESLKFFDKALILNALSWSYKKPKVKISTSHGCDVPRESVYDTELMRILANWLQKLSWSVVGQWHSENNLRRHKYSDIVLKKDSHTIVLELLATGEPSSVQSHIEKTPEYAALLSANQAWVVHFTRQEDYNPIWQSDMNVNVVHFAHDPGFTNVVMSARWTDSAGEIHQEVGRSLPLD